MTSCKNIKKQLSAYMDNELPAEKRRQIEGHLAECRDCPQLLAEWKQVYFQLAETPEAPAAPFFETRLQARLEQTFTWRSPLPRSIMRGVLAPAAICLGLLLGSFLGVELNSCALAPLETQELRQSLAGYLDSGFLDAIPPGSLTATFIGLTASNE
jgi:anti-sigma factor RsiW